LKSEEPRLQCLAESSPH